VEENGELRATFHQAFSSFEVFENASPQTFGPDTQAAFRGIFYLGPSHKKMEEIQTIGATNPNEDEDTLNKVSSLRLWSSAYFAKYSCKLPRPANISLG
jgi:hypothetical protein